MIGIILTGHGNISTGIESSIKLIFGETTLFKAIDFTVNMSSEDLEKKIESSIDELNKETGVIVFTDIAGGTPFKISSLLSIKKNNVKVISGMNLPMILEILSEREDVKDIEKLYKYAIEVGKSEIVGFELQIKENEDNFEDGI